MTATLSKNALGLMLPGSTSSYFQDEPQYLDAPRPGTFALAFEAIIDWFAYRAEKAELDQLSDAQLADIGITRAEVPHLFHRDFAIRREQERMANMAQQGRVAGM